MRNDQPAGKVLPNIAEISTPLRKLLSSNQVWQWGPDQEDSYKKLQVEITKPTVLKWYNVQAVFANYASIDNILVYYL